MESCAFSQCAVLQSQSSVALLSYVLQLLQERSEPIDNAYWTTRVHRFVKLLYKKKMFWNVQRKCCHFEDDTRQLSLHFFSSCGRIEFIISSMLFRQLYTYCFYYYSQLDLVGVVLDVVLTTRFVRNDASRLRGWKWISLPRVPRRSNFYSFQQ